MTDYLEVLDLVPDTLAKLVAGLTPGASDTSREPVGGTSEVGIDKANRLDRIDHILGVLARAASETVTLTTEYAELDPVKVDQWEPRAPKVLATDDETTVLATAAPYLAVIRDGLEELDGHPLAYFVTDHLDQLHKIVMRAETPAKSALCRTCGEVAVIAALHRGVGTCALCGKQVGPDAWLDVKEAATLAGCSVKTVQRMIQAGEVKSRGEKSGREVTLSSVIEAKEMREYRMKLGIKTGIKTG